MSRPACRTCRSTDVNSIGVLPDGTAFAGMALSAALPGGLLWRCANCDFVFRDPLLPASRYAELYRNASAGVWSSGVERRDFQLIQQHMAADTSSTNVLEIGCYTGSLLCSLPKHCRLHGVEPNEAAAQIAASRGISIVAGGTAELSKAAARFDAIIACDVIEHLENPLDFLAQLRALLAPGGRVLVSTGNSDAWLWKLVGANFWYCAFPEHVSFIGGRWLRSMAGRAGLQVDRQTSFNYRFGQVGTAAVRSLASALLYGASPRLYRWLHRSLRGESAQGFVPPGCGATKDHVFCVLSAI